MVTKDNCVMEPCFNSHQEETSRQGKAGDIIRQDCNVSKPHKISSFPSVAVISLTSSLPSGDPCATALMNHRGVCVRVCVCVCEYVCEWDCVCACESVCLCACGSKIVYVCAYESERVCVCACTCMWVKVCACGHVCVFVCIGHVLSYQGTFSSVCVCTCL